jgi:TatD DNase family protein
MYDDSIRVCPMDRMLIETDSPYAAPVPNRGKRNEPGYVADVARKIAELKGLSHEEVAAATLKNASSVFSL